MVERITEWMTGRHGAKLFVAALVLVLGSTTGVVVRAATGSSGSSDNTNAAVAVNTQDNTEKVAFSFKVTPSKGDTVDAQNAAVGYSSCENCRTIAIAIQVVIVLESPNVVSPANVALAVNENCSLCETYADARQYVIQPNRMPKFSKENAGRIMALIRQAGQLAWEERNGDIPFDELKARIDAMSQEFASILHDEFRASSDAVTSPAPSGSPTATPDATDANPAGTDEPSGAPTSPEASPETSESPTATPTATTEASPTGSPPARLSD